MEEETVDLLKINGSGTKLLKSIENKRVVMDLEIKAKPSTAVGIRRSK